MMRAFLACPISGEFRQMLERILHDLKSVKADVKWVQAQNLHLTLKFLGDINDSDAAGMTKALKDRCRDVGRLTTDLCAVEVFPHGHRPRLIWGRLDDTEGRFKKIVEDLENIWTKWGIPKQEHSFKPHITLGRFKSSRGVKNLMSFIDQMTVDHAITQIWEKIILYKSTLTPQGPIYEVLEEFTLI